MQPMAPAITGTHINYYFLCHRKLWLFANGINMEHNSDHVYEDKLIHETSHPQRSEKYRNWSTTSSRYGCVEATEDLFVFGSLEANSTLYQSPQSGIEILMTLSLVIFLPRAVAVLNNEFLRPKNSDPVHQKRGSPCLGIVRRRSASLHLPSPLMCQYLHKWVTTPPRW